MTRIGVFSDSHGDKQALCDLLEKMGYIDAACFLGDVASDADYLESLVAVMPNHPRFYAVRGNNDYAYACFLQETCMAQIGGKRIYMTHGHRHTSLMSLAYTAKENGADVALFGHTHRAFCEEAYGVLLLNPGSAGNYCRGGAARASVLEIEGNNMRVVDITL